MTAIQTKQAIMIITVYSVVYHSIAGSNFLFKISFK